MTPFNIYLFFVNIVLFLTGYCVDDDLFSRICGGILAEADLYTMVKGNVVFIHVVIWYDNE